MQAADEDGEIGMERRDFGVGEKPMEFLRMPVMRV